MRAGGETFTMLCGDDIIAMAVVFILVPGDIGRDDLQGLIKFDICFYCLFAVVKFGTISCNP